MVESNQANKGGSTVAASKNAANDQPKVQAIGPQDPPAPQGMKAYKVLGSRFELPENFDIIDPVGSGAYGVVVAAKDKDE